MKLLPLALTTFLVGTGVNAVVPPLKNKLDYDSRTYFVIELNDTTTVDSFLANRGPEWSYEHEFGSLPNHHLFSVPYDAEVASIPGIRDRPKEQIDAHLRTLPLHRRDLHSLMTEELTRDGLRSLQTLSPKKLEKRLPVPELQGRGLAGKPTDSNQEKLYEIAEQLDISDPIFISQWHLINTFQPGEDLNVSGVWLQNITGKGVAVAVVDDGLELDHPDLHDNFFAEGSYDFNDHREEPRPELDDDRHGTRCAGEIAAVRNDVCGLGVAYEASIAGIRILSGRISEAEEALSLNYAMDKNDIYSCSWGPPDDGRSVAEPGMVVRRALINGVQNGRDNKGSIFVFASGNGATHGDNCNFDGYTNSIYSITVAAIDRQGRHPFYSEECSANMVVTYSSGSNDHIHTTDFHGGCTDSHGGTSAAAPIAAGVFALVLEARPELTWRDMQYLALDTAVPVNDHDGKWQETTIGKRYSHRYGYGKLDAYAIVERAKTWELVKPQAWYFAPTVEANAAIGHGEKNSAKSSIQVSKEDIEQANIGRLEHVNVFLTIEHERRGALTVILRSPSGVESRLAEPRKSDTSNEGLIGWTFMSVAHWGEDGVGEWTLEVINDQSEDAEGSLVEWRLKLWGEAADESKAKLFPLPEDQSVDPDPDHRPPEATPSSSVISSANATVPTEAPTGTSTPSSSTTTQDPENSSLSSVTPSPSSTHGMWSLIPTFGLTSHTLAWVYGSILLIVAFLSGIGIYICCRRRRSGPRYQAFKDAAPAYEFDVLSHSDGDELSESRLLDDELDGLSNTFEDDDDDDDYHANHDRGPTVGQRARGLYENTTRRDSQEGEELFRVDSDEE
uniref:ARAD1D46200p n=1 Tax=Blastobotrys adeninivorans TaxID=409370 RepID=A0A060TCW0_BLAAD